MCHQPLLSVHRGFLGRNNSVCPLATEHQLPDAGLYDGEALVQLWPLKPQAATRPREAGKQAGLEHQQSTGSWNLTPGVGPGLHGSRGFITRASTQLGGLLT